MPDFFVQTACHGVWGIAVTDPSRALELLPTMLQLASKHIHILTRSSDSTSKLCSAMSLARFRDDAFMERLSSFLLAAGPAGSAAASTVAAAAAAGGSDSGMLMAESAASGISRIRPGSPLDRWQHRSVPQHLVSIASAMARLGFSQHTALLQLVIQQYLDRVQSPHSSSSSSSALQQQQAVLLLWASAVLDMQQPVQLLHQLLSLLKGVTDLPTASLAQLVQVYMWLQVRQGEGAHHWNFQRVRRLSMHAIPLANIVACGIDKHSTAPVSHLRELTQHLMLLYLWWVWLQVSAEAATCRTGTAQPGG